MRSNALLFENLTVNDNFSSFGVQEAAYSAQSPNAENTAEDYLGVRDRAHRGLAPSSTR